MIPGPGWYPVHLAAEGDELTWLHLPGQVFKEPFFEDTVRRQRRTSPSATTSLDVLREDPPGAVPPCALFFHASRCGSTLAMQVLGRVPGGRAISEAPAIDQWLHAPATAGLPLRPLLLSFGRPETPGPLRWFLKLDSWHLPHLERVKRAFPEIPRYFLYRDPRAILRSHRRERGSQMAPGMMDARRFGIDPATVDPADLEGYAARVLEAIFLQAVAAVEGGDLIPVCHSQLPAVLWDGIGGQLGLPVDGWAAAHERSRYDAKRIHELHTVSAGPLVDTRPALMAAFARLEAWRAGLAGVRPPELLD